MYHKIFVAVLGALVICLYNSCSCLKLNRTSSQTKASLIAKSHLDQLSNIPKFNNLEVSTVYSVYELSGKSPKIFDVKLIDNDGNDRGYIIVNLDKKDYPILEFTTDGSTLHEQFLAQIEHPNFRVVWLSPMLSIAINQENEILAKIGDSNPDGLESKKMRSKEDYQYFDYSLTWENWLKLRKRNKEVIKKEWKSLRGRTKTGHVILNGGIYDKPSGYYFEQFVEGFDRTPLLNQIPKNKGLNSGKNCPSGCGATAWMTLLTHHDLLWAPELLRGSQNANGSKGPAIVWETYIDSLMMQLAAKLETECTDSEGTTSDTDMEKGFDYLENDLGFNYTHRSQEVSDLSNFWNPDENKVIAKVHQAILIDKRPILIKIPNHFCVAVGVLARYIGDGNLEPAWVVINDGHGNIKYTPTHCLEQYWYFKDIASSDLLDFKLPFTGIGPTLLTTKGTGEFYDKLWLFWLDNLGKINYVSGSPGIIPSTKTISYSRISETINVNAVFPPSLHYDGNFIYLIYVDTNYRIHLMYKSEQSNKFEEVDFPNLLTSVRPSIAGGIGDWLTVAFSTSNYLSMMYGTNYSGVQLISTNRDITQSNAWPTGVIPISENSYPVSIDYGYWLKITEGWDRAAKSLSMTRAGNDNILYWRNWDTDPDSPALNFRLSRKWEDHFLDPEPLFRSPRYYSFENNPAIPGVIGDNPFIVSTNNGTLIASKGYNENRVIIHSFYTNIKKSRGYIPGKKPNPNPINTTYETAEIKQEAWLTKSINSAPSLAHVDFDAGINPMLAAAYTDENNNIWIRLMSIDTPPSRIPSSSFTEYKLEGIQGYIFTTQIEGTVPLYMLYSERARDHFYTISEDGASSIGSWEPKGIAGYVYPGPGEQEHVPLFRWYKPSPYRPKRTDHFYTTSTNEPKPNSGYKYEGIECYMPKINAKDVLPFYRWYKGSINDHFYTFSTNEPKPNSGYKFESEQCYIFPNQSSNTVPLYMLYSERARDHFYTISEDGASSIGSWEPKGIAGYVYPGPGEQEHVPLFRWYKPSPYRPKRTDHFYTTSTNEPKSNSGYKYEGIECYLPLKEATGSVPLYRFYNSTLNDHYYTTNPGVAPTPRQ